MAYDRAGLLASALRLSFFTIAWNGALGTAALVASSVRGSLALASFGLSALLDVSASVVLVWRFRREQQDPVAAEHLERRAQPWIVLALLVVGSYAVVRAVLALIDHSHRETSAFDVRVAALSVVVLPFLGWRMFRVARLLASPAIDAL